MIAPAPEVVRGRAPVRARPDLHARLPEPRRPSRRARLWSVTLGEEGVLGPATRRRLGRALLESVPCAVAAAASVLAVRRALAAPFRPWHAAALGIPAVALAVAGVRAVRDVRAGEPRHERDRVELALLALLATSLAAQAADAAGLGGGASLTPASWLVLAACVALAPPATAAALLLFAVALEAAAWWQAGAALGELRAPAVRAAFALLFGILFHLVLAGRVAAARRAEGAAVARRKRELDERARQLRLLAGAGEASDGGPDRQERLAEAAVLETDGAAQGMLALAEVALGAEVAAVWVLSLDDSELLLWESRAGDGVRVVRRLPAGEGPLGGVVKRGTPVRLHGSPRSANHREDGARPGSLVAVPLRARIGDHLRGVVLVDRASPEPFNEAQEELLVRVASELARAAAAERLLLEGRAHRQEQEGFYAAIEALNRATTPREVFDALIEAAGRLAPVDLGAVTLLEGQGGALTHRVARAAWRAPPEGTPGRSRRDDGAGPRLATALEGRCFGPNGGLVSGSVRLCAALPGRSVKLSETVVFDEEARLDGLASVKVLPLAVGAQVLGTLVVASAKPGAYGPELGRQLEVLALQAADALLRARLFEATERLATTDGLTGLVNHRTFQERLDRHLAEAQRYGKKLSVLLTDIDHFKAVNDTYGHPAGDVVLKGVARVLQKEARTTDVAARYGGEEFALVMPETDLDGALRMAERIRERVAAETHRTEAGDVRVTLSVGIATFPDDASAKATLIELADGGLYHAKRHGRNQAVALSRVRARRRAAPRAGGGGT